MILPISLRADFREGNADGVIDGNVLDKGGVDEKQPGRLQIGKVSIAGILAHGKKQIDAVGLRVIDRLVADHDAGPAPAARASGP